MLKRYEMLASAGGHVVAAPMLPSIDSEDIAEEVSPTGWVRYEDAAALELRIRELEQQLMTETEKRAEFEKDSGALRRKK